MADYLVLKHKGDDRHIRGWRVVGIARDRGATNADKARALEENFEGNGRYVVVGVSSANVVEAKVEVSGSREITTSADGSL